MTCTLIEKQLVKKNERGSCKIIMKRVAAVQGGWVEFLQLVGVRGWW
jgi:hypothetical protein